VLDVELRGHSGGQGDDFSKLCADCYEVYSNNERTAELVAAKRQISGT
jgi:hypothetical protein